MNCGQFGKIHKMFSWKENIYKVSPQMILLCACWRVGVYVRLLYAEAFRSSNNCRHTKLFDEVQLRSIGRRMHDRLEHKLIVRYESF